MLRRTYSNVSKAAFKSRRRTNHGQSSGEYCRGSEAGPFLCGINIVEGQKRGRFCGIYIVESQKRAVFVELIL